MINHNTKEAIKIELNKQITHVGSANKLSRDLGISNATVSNIINDKSEMISDDMWRKVASSLKIQLKDQWLHAETTPYTHLTAFFNDARINNSWHALTTKPGGGKTYALDRFKETYKNVFYVKCERHTTERDFLKSILVSMHVKPVSHKITDLLKDVVRELRKLENPVIIIDEIEKVKNDVMLLIIDMYNSLPDCGMCIIGTPYLKKRIETGVERGTLGYNEIISRFGGKVIEIKAPTHTDAANVIRVNGIDNTRIALINKKHVVLMDHIITESDDEFNDVDLRRVFKLVTAYKRKGGENA